MLKIVALNEPEQDQDSNDEATVTNEAQETIAESEYIRAIKLKFSGKLDAALTLLTELLDTKVLNENCKEEKLWSIRYNCHKNIAMIYEEKQQFELALLNYMRAMQIDKTDVYMMHKFGQLALKCHALELAECAFENCLKRNPQHWNAADGLLRTLCERHNMLGAYGWALKLYRRDKHYQLAMKVLNRITTQFEGAMDLYNKIWPITKQEETEILEFQMSDSEAAEVFPVSEEERLTRPVVVQPQNIDQFRLTEINWLTLGQYITQVYNYLAETQQSMLYVMCYNDLIAGTECGEVALSSCGASENIEIEETKSVSENSTNETGEAAEQNELMAEQNVATPQSVTFASPSRSEAGKNTADGNANDDSDSNAKSDSNDSTNNKPKVKRRCNDLHMLEQWGWHKSRRYSSRKKAQDKVEVDTSLNAFLRKIFAKFAAHKFEQVWPFNEEGKDKGNTQNVVCEKCKNLGDVSLESFVQTTQLNFTNLIQKLKSQKFDLMYLIFEWLRALAPLFQLKLPDVIKTKFLEIFTLYLKHYDWSNWHLLNDEDFEASYIICLLYLELDFELTYTNNCELSIIWQEVLHHMLLQSGPILLRGQQHAKYYLRLVHLRYGMYNHKKVLDQCLNFLNVMHELLEEEDDDFILHMPNMQSGCITKAYIKTTHLEMDRQMSLIKVPKLYESEKWTELSEIIMNNLNHLQEKNECELWFKDFRAQIELLINALWNAKNYENCLIWSEMFLHYATDQYLKEARTSICRQKLWAQSINFILSYVQSIILNEGHDILCVLNNYLPRLVLNIIRLLSYQLDAPFDKNNNPAPELKFKLPWIILHQIALREENQQLSPIKAKTSESNSTVDDLDEEVIPNSFLLLFTAHQFLGKRQWCTRDNGEFLLYILDAITPNIRAPLYDTCRDAVYEHIEQITYCLFGYPQKKAKLRHLEEHESQQLELNWERSVQIFTIYKPECLPEFNSYKLESITADQEQLLIKIIALMPNEICPSRISNEITEFLAGNIMNCDLELDETTAFKLPFKISSIFYLLADYYFKNRDLIKAIKFYTLDLACNPLRFDSWAGMALSKASRVDTKINSLVPLNFVSVLNESDDVIRCFKRCISLNRTLTLLWIEYGSFAYTIHSYCSRYLKHESEKLSFEHFSFAEERKEKMLSIAYDCFSLATQLQDSQMNSASNNLNNTEDGEGNEEIWLCQYMLGKIAEKRKEEPQVYLNYYLKASTYLYESNATYPIKINHSNPTALAVEALEVFYRTNSAIIKYLEHTKEISRANGDFIKSVLNHLTNSPFAFNKAKIDGSCFNALKRKINDKQTVVIAPKQYKVEPSPNPAVEPGTQPENKEANAESNAAKTQSKPTIISTSSSGSSGSETEDDASTESKKSSEENKGPYTAAELDVFYQKIVQNLEECVTRFSEHFKSIYRLVYHYLNSPPPYCDYRRCEALLLGQYRTKLGNVINGLFNERKNNNFFNGIWRIPSSEIDRPGSFSAQLVKCVSILIQVLWKNNNHNLLIDIGLQLFKTPDNDKRYIKDSERLELYQQCVDFCTRIMQNILKQYASKRNDEEILTLLLDCYRIHKKCQKYMNQREPQFVQLMVDIYKLYIQDKVEIVPENLNLFELAIKLCLQEIALRKNIEKAGEDIMQVQSQANFTRKNNIPGLSMRRGRAPVNKPATQQTTTNLPAQFMPNIFNTAAKTLPTATTLPNFAALPFQTNTPEFQRLCEEYYKQICKSGQINPVPMLSYPQALAALSESTHQHTTMLPTAARVTTTNVAATTSSNTTTSNLNLLQKLPPTLDVTALSKSATTTNQGISLTSADGGVTLTAITNRSTDMNKREIQAGDYQNKIKRGNNKSRQASYQRPASTPALPKMEQINFLDVLAHKNSNPELNLAAKQTRPMQPNVSSAPSPYNLSHTGLYNTTIMPTNLSTAGTLLPPPPAQSPTKTLQQKLIERQKANANNTQAAVDVIYID